MASDTIVVLFGIATNVQGVNAKGVCYNVYEQFERKTKPHTALNVDSLIAK